METNNSIDLMLDLETTGTEAGCCILSVGIVSFDENFKIYEKISHQDCRNHGLKDSPATMSWWATQPNEARQEAFSGTKRLIEVMGFISDSIVSIQLERKIVNKNIFLWGNGADFDQPILKAAFSAVDMVFPFAPFNNRCYRTLKNLPWTKGIVAEKFEGIKHNALNDAIFQARHAMKILREMKEKSELPALP